MVSKKNILKIFLPIIMLFVSCVFIFAGCDLGKNDTPNNDQETNQNTDTGNNTDNTNSDDNGDNTGSTDGEMILTKDQVKSELVMDRDCSISHWQYAKIENYTSDREEKTSYVNLAGDAWWEEYGDTSVYHINDKVYVYNNGQPNEFVWLASSEYYTGDMIVPSHSEMLTYINLDITLMATSTVFKKIVTDTEIRYQMQATGLGADTTEFLGADLDDIVASCIFDIDGQFTGVELFGYIDGEQVYRFIQRQIPQMPETPEWFDIKDFDNAMEMCLPPHGPVDITQQQLGQMFSNINKDVSGWENFSTHSQSLGSDIDCYKLSDDVYAISSIYDKWLQFCTNDRGYVYIMSNNGFIPYAVIDPSYTYEQAKADLQANMDAFDPLTAPTGMTFDSCSMTYMVIDYKMQSSNYYVRYKAEDNTLYTSSFYVDKNNISYIYSSSIYAKELPSYQQAIERSSYLSEFDIHDFDDIEYTPDIFLGMSFGTEEVELLSDVFSTVNDWTNKEYIYSDTNTGNRVDSYISGSTWYAVINKGDDNIQEYSENNLTYQYINGQPYVIKRQYNDPYSWHAFVNIYRPLSTQKIQGETSTLYNITNMVSYYSSQTPEYKLETAIVEYDNLGNMISITDTSNGIYKKITKLSAGFETPEWFDINDFDDVDTIDGYEQQTILNYAQTMDVFNNQKTADSVNDLSNDSVNNGGDVVIHMQTTSNGETTQSFQIKHTNEDGTINYSSYSFNSSLNIPMSMYKDGVLYTYDDDGTPLSKETMDFPQPALNMEDMLDTSVLSTLRDMDPDKLDNFVKTKEIICYDTGNILAQTTARSVCYKMYCDLLPNNAGGDIIYTIKYDRSYIYDGSTYEHQEILTLDSIRIEMSNEAYSMLVEYDYYDDYQNYLSLFNTEDFADL